jgi:hypothetical protein
MTEHVLEFRGKRRVFGPANTAWPLMTSTLRFAIVRARFAGMSLIMSFSRSISAAQSSLAP